MDNGIGPDLRIYKTLANKEFTVITLRDVFAAMALSGLSREDFYDDKKNRVRPEGYAFVAYQLADAMIAERSK